MKTITLLTALVAGFTTYPTNAPRCSADAVSPSKPHCHSMTCDVVEVYGIGNKIICEYTACWHNVLTGTGHCRSGHCEKPNCPTP